MLYSNTDFNHVKNFFVKILLKTVSICDVRLQNYGAHWCHKLCAVFWTTQYGG